MAAEGKTRAMVVNMDEQLFQAVRLRLVRRIKSLIRRGADVNGYRDERCWSCLLIALYDKPKEINVDVVNELLYAGADINAEDLRGNTCLHYAAESLMHPGLLTEMLLNVGAGRVINSQNCYGYSALHTAVVNGKRYRINIHNTHSTSTSQGTVAIVQHLLKAGADSSLKECRGRTSLHFCRSMDCDVLRILLDAPMTKKALGTLDRDGVTPLQAVVRYCKVEMAKMMLEAGADVNFISPRPNLLEALWEKCWSSTEGSALHIAAFEANEDMVELLLEYGANVNALNKEGSSVVWLAAKCFRTNRDYVPTLRLLLAAGADMDYGGPWLPTPFRTTLYCGNVGSVRYSIDLNAKGIVSDIVGPILHAAALNSVDGDKIIRYLVRDRLCDVEEKDKQGRTALYLLAELKSAMVAGAYVRGSILAKADVLLQEGATIGTRSKEGHTILDIAILKNGIQVLQAIVKYLALRRQLWDNNCEENVWVRAMGVAGLSDYSERCISELNSMKSAIIDRSITYLSIIQKDTAKCLRNRVVMQHPLLVSHENGNLRKIYPIYSSFLIQSFIDMKRRRDLEYIAAEK
ncbi:hypothetical protein QAD02_013519 [Eretmocerus hayati]|uniref:Uncharacterized protein n=1 Tax=Eretmocerus hayati TaxID=131215 RepID=A0ACC2P2X4_9HYME|nr:hypothetical protein QAD02_013519 [Eretmocerus hayati]